MRKDAGTLGQSLGDLSRGLDRSRTDGAGRNQVGDVNLEVGARKTKKARSIPISDRLAAVLEMRRVAVVGDEALRRAGAVIISLDAGRKRAIRTH
jgi:hypothetical protein